MSIIQLGIRLSTLPLCQMAIRIQGFAPFSVMAKPIRPVWNFNCKYCFINPTYFIFTQHVQAVLVRVIDLLRSGRDLAQALKRGH